MYRITTNVYNHMTEKTTSKSYLINEHDFNLYSVSEGIERSRNAHDRHVLQSKEYR